MDSYSLRAVLLALEHQGIERAYIKRQTTTKIFTRRPHLSLHFMMRLKKIQDWKRDVAGRLNVSITVLCGSGGNIQKFKLGLWRVDY